MNALHTTFLELGSIRQVDTRQLLLRAGEVAQRLIHYANLYASAMADAPTQR